jgi:integrase
MQAPITIPESMIFDNRLTIGDIRVYCALVKIADGTNQCIVAKKQISQISGMDKVCRHTNNLLKSGYLKINQGRQGDFNKYTLPLVIPIKNSSNDGLLSVFLQEYLQFSQGYHSKSTTRTYRSCMRELIAFTGDIELKQIDIRLMEKFLAQKRATTSDYSARKYFISLKSIFSKALAWGLIEQSPFKHIKMPRVAEREVDYFKIEEFQHLLSFINDSDFLELVICLFYTSFRRSELLNLKWGNIDFENNLVHLCNTQTFSTKNLKNRVVGMSKPLYDLLLRRKMQSQSDCDWIFYNSKKQRLDANSVSKKFKYFVRLAGFGDRKLRLHSIRHSSAMLLLSRGVPSLVLQHHLGHSKITTTQKYVHVPHDVLIRAANALPVIARNGNQM